MHGKVFHEITKKQVTRMITNKTTRHKERKLTARGCQGFLLGKNFTFMENFLRAFQ